MTSCCRSWILAGTCSLAFLSSQAATDTRRVYWTDKDAGRIEVADLDGSRRATLLDGVTDPRGIAVDTAANAIYWASHTTTGAIYRMDCDGNNLEVILSGLDEPADLALDRTNGVLYWAEEGSHRIRRVTIGPDPEPETLVSGLNRPYYIEIDPEGGFLYWSDFSSALIHRATIDGETPEILVSGQSRVRDIAVADGVIYWCDRNSSQIRRRAISGTGTGTILFSGSADSLDRPHGLVLDPGSKRMFWTDTETDEINTGAMDGSGPVSTLATSALLGAWGIALSQTVPSPFQSWQSTHFTAEELAIPANEALLWGESADPDHDQCTNLLEYAQGTDPRSPAGDPTAMEGTITTDAGSTTFQLVYRIRNDDPVLSAVVESSTSLQAGEWQVDQLIELLPRLTDPADSAYDFVTLRSTAGSGSLFARLRITR